MIAHSHILLSPVLGRGPSQIEHVLCAIAKITNTSSILNLFIEVIRNSNKISVDHAVLELLIKRCKILFCPITQEPLGLLIFEYNLKFLNKFVSGGNLYNIIFFFQNSISYFEIMCKTK